jgi:hypothetical protein
MKTSKGAKRKERKKKRAISIPFLLMLVRRKRMMSKKKRKKNTKFFNDIFDFERKGDNKVLFSDFWIFFLLFGGIENNIKIITSVFSQFVFTFFFFLFWSLIFFY